MAGVLLTLLLARIAWSRTEPRPGRARVAWRHAVALAIGTIALVVSMSVGLQRDLRVQHAFLTVTIVLVGSSGLLVEHAELVAERLLLTALGALFAVAAALVLRRTSTSTVDR